MVNWRNRVAGAVFPIYSQLLDQINQNALVMRWYHKNDQLPAFPDRKKYFDYVSASYIGDDAIDYLEFGVYQGESIRHWAQLNRNPNSRFHGFDSFEGLPEGWAGLPTGAYTTEGAIPVIDDPRVNFIKGWFQHTLPTFLKSYTAKNRILLHIDSDLYTSALYVLTMLHDLLPAGTIILFDEYSSPLHEFRAFNDYLSSYLREAKGIAITTDMHGRAAFILE